MQRGMTPEEMQQTLERHSQMAADFRVSDDALAMEPGHNGGGPQLVMGEDERRKAMGLTSNAHSQLAQTLKIPKPYYDRMLDQEPRLLAGNVNTWLHQEADQPKQRLLRVMGDNCRAVLSPGYRIIDNLPLLGAILPVLRQEMSMEILNANVGDDLFYLKVVHSDLSFNLARTGDERDIVRPGLRFRNSETGRGGLWVERFFYRLVCLNGMTMETPFKRRHVGRRHVIDADYQEVLTDETRRLEDRALFAKIQDVVRASFNEEDFAHRARMLFEARDDKIPRKSRKPVVEEVGQRMRLTESQTTQVYELLCENSQRDGFTRFGLAQSVTQLANEESIPYETACDLERAGGRVIEMAPTEWRAVLDKAAD